MLTHTQRNRRNLFVLLGLFILLLTGKVRAETNQTKLAVVAQWDLTQLSLDDLIRVTVTSVSKRPEELLAASSAIYVITPEDLRRSGVTTIADALRMVPGMDVARVDSHTWAISARGLNSMFSRFLQVQMDGRSLYSSLFSGVFWDVQDTMMEDIDRIEVIRGPGATLWGANAVNGVINITTKSAKETQGLLLTGGGGNQEQGFGALRYGGKIDDDVFYRVYVKGFNRDNSVFPDGSEAADGWSQERGGFRVDWEPPSKDHFTFQADLYNGSEGQTYNVTGTAPPSYMNTFNDTISVYGGDVIGRWTHPLANGGELTWQSYYEYSWRGQTTFGELRDTFETDMQHRFPLGQRHEITWGLGYMITYDDIRNTSVVSFNPKHKSLQVESGFVQDEFTLIPDRLHLKTGSKLEHNDYTGWLVQPSARIAWTPTTRQTVWAAVSRAERTPSRADTEITFQQEPIPAPIPPTNHLVPVIHGNPKFDNETEMAYELGYRIQPHDRLTLDLAGYYSVYSNLRSVEQGSFNPSTVPPSQNLYFLNKLKGDIFGLEVLGRWQVIEHWRLEVTYTYTDVQIHATEGSTDKDSEKNVPRNQGGLRSLIDLPQNIELDTWVRAVDEMAVQKIAGYVELDAHVAWRPSKNLEIAVVGENLLHDRHAEFASAFTIQNTDVVRSIYGKVTLHY